ncbi:2-phosphosulfolactate phosphatase [Paludibacter sp. 221]|uniref:2-phosphosulfolactate phosphatase n=1 Tax=Paludibacter sp. 221 TaxID=2302939 RepID=UPI0013D2DBA9|nr:2-phosphosulfolactate phosphatase [Paludibacter sp. 221]NDV46414.1 2-phosphosulfolactate phosphatase [Paludibacter sp. 221]
MKKKIDICLSPELFPFYNSDKKSCVVVVDIFRATTSMCVAFHSGVKSIIPMADIEKAKELKEQGFLVGAERNVARCDFADFGNSPFDYMDEKIGGREIVMTTTNGTQAIEVASANDMLIIGSFANFSTVLSYLQTINNDVIILCAGWNGRVNVEDTLFAAALTESLLGTGEYIAESDAVFVALLMWQDAKNDIRGFLMKSEHISRLLAHGLQDDIDFCLQFDTVDSLPFYDKTTARLKLMAGGEE